MSWTHYFVERVLLYLGTCCMGFSSGCFLAAFQYRAVTMLLIVFGLMASLYLLSDHFREEYLSEPDKQVVLRDANAVAVVALSVLMVSGLVGLLAAFQVAWL